MARCTFLVLLDDPENTRHTLGCCLSDSTPLLRVSRRVMLPQQPVSVYDGMAAFSTSGRLSVVIDLPTKYGYALMA